MLGDDYQPLSRADLLTAANDAEPVAPPGQRYLYSNAGYSVLTAVIETVAATSYEEFLAEALFTPAGMTDTGYVLPNWDPERIAVEYDADGTALGRPNERPWADDGPFWNLRGNGGILSTADDMIAWSAALDGEDVLSRAAVRRMLEPHVAEDEGGESFYGYGWVILDIDGTTVAWHNGSSGAAYSEMLRPIDGGPTVFWATNAAVRSGAWELEESDLAARLTEALI